MKGLNEERSPIGVVGMTRFRLDRWMDGGGGGGGFEDHRLTPPPNSIVMYPSLWRTKKERKTRKGIMSIAGLIAEVSSQDANPGTNVAREALGTAGRG